MARHRDVKKHIDEELCYDDENDEEEGVYGNGDSPYQRGEAGYSPSTESYIYKRSDAPTMGAFFEPLALDGGKGSGGAVGGHHKKGTAGKAPTRPSSRSSATSSSPHLQTLPYSQAAGGGGDYEGDDGEYDYDEEYYDDEGDEYDDNDDDYQDYDHTGKKGNKGGNNSKIQTKTANNNNNKNNNTNKSKPPTVPNKGGVTASSAGKSIAQPRPVGPIGATTTIISSKPSTPVPSSLNDESKSTINNNNNNDLATPPLSRSLSSSKPTTTSSSTPSSFFPSITVPPSDPSDSSTIDPPTVFMDRRQKERELLLEAEAKKELKPRINLICIGHVDAGKCFGKGTMIMMNNGKEKKIEEIKKGELVMGDDWRPREVAAINRGRDRLFKITPIIQKLNNNNNNNPKEFVCNSAHILVLRFLNRRLFPHCIDHQLIYYRLDSNTHHIHRIHSTFPTPHQARSACIELERRCRLGLVKDILSPQFIWHPSVIDYLSHSSIIRRSSFMFTPSLSPPPALKQSSKIIMNHQSISWPFTISDIGDGDYYGFSLRFPSNQLSSSISSHPSSFSLSSPSLSSSPSPSPSNPHRFLLSDLTICHNSTLMGHLLYQCGEVSQRDIHKYEKQSKEVGKGSFAFAWVLDQSETERSRGVTTETAISHFSTQNRSVTLLDAPGHRDFIPAMISGTSQADNAILVVPAQRGEFEGGFSDEGQTKEHAILARALGVSQLIVAVNKLDAVDWDEERYKEITRHVLPFLKLAGYKDKDILVCPVSGLTGENIREQKEDKLLSWYKGPTLLQIIDSLSPPSRYSDKPLRLCIGDVSKSMTLGVCVSGRIETGSIMPKDRLLLLPLNELVTIKSIEHAGQSLAIARAGDQIDIGIRDISDPSILSVGQWLCDPSSPIPIITRFRAQIITMNYKVPLLTGMQLIMYTANTQTPVILSELCALLLKDGMQRLYPRALSKSQSAIVEIKTKYPIAIELYKNFKELGRFTLRRENETVAAGIIIKLFREKSNKQS